MSDRPYSGLTLKLPEEELIELELDELKADIVALEVAREINASVLKTEANDLRELLATAISTEAIKDEDQVRLMHNLVNAIDKALTVITKKEVIPLGYGTQTFVDQADADFDIFTELVKPVSLSDIRASGPPMKTVNEQILEKARATEADFYKRHFEVLKELPFSLEPQTVTGELPKSELGHAKKVSRR